jgi:hypothetical protein
LGDKDVEIEILREGDELEGYERKVFEAIKESAEDGKVLRLGESLEPSKAKKLHDTLESVKDEVYDLMTQTGYFQEKPNAVRKKYAFLGLVMFLVAFITALVPERYIQIDKLGMSSSFIIIIFIIVLALPTFFTLFGKKFYRIITFMLIMEFILFIFLLYAIFLFYINGAIYDLISFLHHPSVEVPLGIALAGVIISFIGLYMPRKTERGVEMYKRVLGFKEFIKRVEEDYLKLMDPTKLERIIPYAIVLGIENIWIEKISKALSYIPAWIQASTRDVGKSISITTSSLNTSLPALASLGTSSGGRSGFGGGGRSGGGAGGGGGGAW